MASQASSRLAFRPTCTTAAITGRVASAAAPHASRATDVGREAMRRENASSPRRLPAKPLVGFSEVTALPEGRLSSKAPMQAGA